MNLLLLVGLLLCSGVAAHEDPKIKVTDCMVLIDQNGETFTGFLFSKKKQVGEIKSEDTFKDNKAGTKDEFGDTFPVDESKKNMFDAKKITEAADAAATAKDAAATAAEASELARELPKGYGDSIYLRREITAEATAAAAAAEAAATLAPLVKEDGTFNPTTFNPDSSAEAGIPKKDYLKTTKALAGWYEQAIWAMLDKNLKEIRKDKKLPACKVTKIVVRQTGRISKVLLDRSCQSGCAAFGGTSRRVAWVDAMKKNLEAIPKFQAGGFFKNLKFDVDNLSKAEEDKLADKSGTGSWATAFAKKNFFSSFPFHR